MKILRNTNYCLLSEKLIICIICIPKRVFSTFGSPKKEYSAISATLKVLRDLRGPKRVIGEIGHPKKK